MSAADATIEPKDADPPDAEPPHAVPPPEASATSPEASLEATPHWRPPPFWRFVQVLARLVIPLVCRLRVTGDVPDAYRNGPLILAGNHIATFDPICFAAASRIRRVAPRMMATGGL